MLCTHLDMLQRIHLLFGSAFTAMLLLSGRCYGQADATFDAPAAPLTSPGDTDGLRARLLAPSGLRPAWRHLLPSSKLDQERRRPGNSAGMDGTYVSPFASALQAAWKKGVIKLGVERYTEVLIQCQKEQSPVLTMPFQQADSQQAHCFRF